LAWRLKPVTPSRFSLSYPSSLNTSRSRYSLFVNLILLNIVAEIGQSLDLANSFGPTEKSVPVPGRSFTVATGLLVSGFGQQTGSTSDSTPTL